MKGYIAIFYNDNCDKIRMAIAAEDAIKAAQCAKSELMAAFPAIDPSDWELAGVMLDVYWIGVEK